MADSELELVFNLFAAFGDRHSTSAALDGVKFLKLVADSKLIDGMFTKADADLIFASEKAKVKSSRKIDFRQFKDALKEIANKKYGNDPDGPAKVRQAVVESGGPQQTNVHLPQASGIFERLTDLRSGDQSKGYLTGSHKQRFDEFGRGKGIYGRDAPSLGTGTVAQYHGGNVTDLSQIVRPTLRGGTHMNDYAKRAEREHLSSPARPPLPLSASTALAASRSAGSASITSPGRGSPGSASAQRPSSPFRYQPSPGAFSDTSITGRPATAPHLHAQNAVMTTYQHEQQQQQYLQSSSAGTLSPGQSAAASHRSPGGPGAFGAAGRSPLSPGRTAASPAGGDGQHLGITPRKGTLQSATKSRFIINAPDLHNIFLGFCAFGSTSRMPDELDSAKFSKLCRENGVIDNRNISPAAVDVAFATVAKVSDAKDPKVLRAKRSISYSQFQQAIGLLAAAKYPNLDPTDATILLVELIIKHGGPEIKYPSLPNAVGVFERLTNVANFTGSHVHRFDLETGQGLGADGRD